MNSLAVSATFYTVAGVALGRALDAIMPDDTACSDTGSLAKQGALAIGQAIANGVIAMSAVDFANRRRWGSNEKSIDMLALQTALLTSQPKFVNRLSHVGGYLVTVVRDGVAGMSTMPAVAPSGSNKPMNLGMRDNTSPMTIATNPTQGSGSDYMFAS